jgi:hypothetical protein
VLSVKLTRRKHAVYASRLNYLSNLYSTAYETTGNRDFLDQSIHAGTRAVRFTPNTNENLPRGLANLAGKLVLLYDATGDMATIARALALSMKAVELAEFRGAAIRRFALNNLSVCYSRVYQASGRLEDLQQAVDAARDAVTAMQPPHPECLDKLSCYLDDRFDVIGDGQDLLEALKLQRAAVEATTPDDPAWPDRCGNLSNRLLAFYTHLDPLDIGILHEAIAIRREALKKVTPRDIQLSIHFTGLANVLNRLYRSTGDTDALDESLSLSRRAFAETPPGRTERALLAHNYASDLALKYEATREQRYLKEARDITSEIRGRGPIDHVIQARTRAHLAWLDGNLDSVLQELLEANEAFADEIERTIDDPVSSRHLAGHTERLIGDLAGCHAARGELVAAVDVIESKRIWVREPPAAQLDLLALPAMPVVWLFASRWETRIIWTHDHRSDAFDSIRVPIDRQTLGRTIIRGLNARRLGTSTDELSEVIALTSQILGAVPTFPQLLVVPVGVCSLLPFSSAQTGDGASLIDNCAVTVAPSLAWAAASYRRRSGGTSLGVFHPGHPRLDLEEDRRLFISQFPDAEILDAPRAGEVLKAFSGGVSVGHVSCHGAYNSLNPLLSSLELNGSLVVADILQAAGMPWLVNLSGCETGVPDQRRSEQSVSFPSCFLRGGAAHVVATSWTVGNRVATQVNRAFYDALSVNAHPAIALQRALVALRGVGLHSGAQARSVEASETQNVTPRFDLANPLVWAAWNHYGSPW